MSSTNKTSLGLNMWEASDKPVRQDFVNDNTIIDEKITQLNSNINNVSGSLNNVNSNLAKLSLTHLGTVTNTDTLALPADFAELYVCVGSSQDSGNRNNFNFVIPKNTLTNANGLFYSGSYFSSNSSNGCQLQVTNGYIGIASVYVNGIESTTQYQMIVNYR